jgi:hypothetical protein
VCLVLADSCAFLEQIAKISGEAVEQLRYDLVHEHLSGVKKKTRHDDRVEAAEVARMGTAG